MRIILRSALLIALTSCGAATTAPPPPPASPPTENPLDALEQRLARASSFRMRVRMASGGRIESHFDGTIVAGPDGKMRLALQGAFGGKDVDALLVCDGRTMRGGTSGQRFELDAAPGLRQGMVVGFVRMGLMHDAARLASGRMPDYVDGSAGAHLAVVGASHAAGEEMRGHATELWSFALYVDHEHAADEMLWLDASTGLPVRRRVVVHLPEGDMDDGEEYDEFAVGEEEDPATFVVNP